MTNPQVFIGIATHKKYQMPLDEIYHPIFVGAAGKPNISYYERDDTGDNISIKNTNYCELTAIYYVWKNIYADYKGIVHYRRHFSSKKSFAFFRTGKFRNIIHQDQLRNKLRKSDVLVPNKRKYYIESNYSHYIHAHGTTDIDETRNIIEKNYPEYMDSFDKVMNATSAHMFNMFVMKSDIFDSYCTWMFDILFKLENRINISLYDDYEKRVYGFVSELLLDVWMTKNEISYTELPIMFMEKQNWLKKIYLFNQRKFAAKK